MFHESVVVCVSSGTASSVGPRKAWVAGGKLPKLDSPAPVARPATSAGLQTSAQHAVAWPIPADGYRTMDLVTVQGWVLNPAHAPVKEGCHSPGAATLTSDQLSMYAALWCGAILFMFDSPRDCIAFFQVSHVISPELC